jgi:hypothetical protein
VQSIVFDGLRRQECNTFATANTIVTCWPHHSAAGAINSPSF